MAVKVNIVSSEKNIALNKPAFQSSDYEFSDKWTADKAVDGSLNTVMKEDSCTHTGDENELSPWWKTDLLNRYEITAVTLYNRAECCHFPPDWFCDKNMTREKCLSHGECR